LTVAGDSLYFKADDGTHGFELWISDGTEAGTSMVKDLNPGTGGGWIKSLASIGDTLYFRGNDGIYGAELWKTDGTKAGTTMVMDIQPGAGNGSPRDMTAVGDTLYFNANDGIHGKELWKSDGTAAGTILVKDIMPGTGNGYLDHLTAAGDRVYFEADDGTNGDELWISDGTEGGTFMVKDIRVASGNASIDYLTPLGDTLYFRADDDVHGTELWKTDGTAIGTVLVMDIKPGIADASPKELAVASDTLYFSARGGGYGNELWKSDGTKAGTMLVRDIYPGGNDSSPSNLAAVGNSLYFAADDGINGRELWTSDGTEAGTVMYANLNPGSNPSTPDELYFDGEVLYFSAVDTLVGREPWAMRLNNAPTADAGGPYSVVAENTVTLDGSASTEPDAPFDSIASYAWDFDGDGQFDDATGATPEFSAAGLVAGTSVSVALQVTDTEGAVHSDWATIYIFGAPVTINGSINSDTIAVTPGSPVTGTDHVVQIGSTQSTYDSSVVNEIHIDALGGTDRITIYGTGQNETVALQSGSIDVIGQTYQFHVTNVESITAVAGSGDHDQVTMTGSAGSNRLYSYADYAVMTDSARSYYYRVTDFDATTVEAPAGGRNYAFLYDSPDNDTLDADPDRVIVNRAVDTPDPTVTTVTGFTRAYVYATRGGTDTASLTGSDTAANRFYGYANYSMLTESRRSFYYYARGFDSVTANSPSAGYTYAYLYDSNGIDQLNASPASATMNRAEPWSDTTANGFKRLYAYSTRGGDDMAALTGNSDGGNYFRATPTYATLTDRLRSFYHYVRGFHSLTATGSETDTWGDRAYLYDSHSDDTLYGRGHSAIVKDTAETVYQVEALYFDLIYARSSDSDTDTDDTVDVDDSLAYNLIRSGTW
jgi:ELWxxDGT repeat protein